MNKIAVYTAITSNYESLKENQNTEGADFFAFLDGSFHLGIWQVLPATKVFSEPRRNARWHKINSHLLFPEHDYTIWLDGSMEMRNPAPEFIKKYLKGVEMAAFRHPDRNCLYQEAEVCKNAGLDDSSILDKQTERYREEGYPEENGLGETKILIRKNCPKVEQFNRLWLHEITNLSLRDQVSFNYCIWKSGVKLNYIELIKDQIIWERYPGCRYSKHRRLPS